MLSSSLPDGFNRQNQLRHHQLILRLLNRLLFLGQWLESLLEQPSPRRRPRPCKDAILAFDLFIFWYFITFDGEYFEHFYFLIRIAIILDKGFKMLNILQA